MWKKALICEEITEEVQRKEKEILEECNKKLGKLNKIIENKENYIINLEKNAGAQGNNDSNVCYKYVVEPREQMIIMNEELGIMKGMLKKIFKKYQEVKAKNLELIQINYVSGFLDI